MNSENVVKVKTKDGLVLIDMDELAFANYDGDSIYLYFKNSKIDFEISDDDVVKELVEALSNKFQ